MGRKHGGKLVLIVCGAASMVGWTHAEEYAFTGARANGMGGANAASVNDASAQWHNPAAFGFFGRAEWAGDDADNGELAQQTFGWELLGIGAGYAMTEDMGRYLDILAGIDFDAFGSGELSSAPQNVESLMAMAGILGSLKPGDALHADASGGTTLQIGHFGIGIRVFGEAAAWSLPDLGNLSLDYATLGSLVDELRTAADNAGIVPGGGPYVLTDSQRTALAEALGGISPGDKAVDILDASLQKLAAKGELDGSEIAKAVDLFKELVPGAGGLLASNETAVVGRGFAMVEIPVSYGWALNRNFSVGATAKAMYGSVIGTQIWIFNEDNDQVLEELSGSAESSLAFGLDLAALYRIPMFQFALVGHNLNRPTFDGYTDTISLNGNPVQVQVPEVKVDPQVTLGLAFVPSRRFTLEANYELLEAGTLLPGYDIRRVSFGGELDLWMLALRLGAYRNLAESWQDWVATAGVGFNLFGVRVDVGGALSLDNNVEYDGHEIPSEARLYAGIGLDF